jgi:hypothetical protein
MSRSKPWIDKKQRTLQMSPFQAGAKKGEEILDIEGAEAKSKEKHGVRDPIPELTITSSYVHSRVDSNTCTMARVDLNPQSGT